ncbi:methyltransferase domain-containing protein [Aquimarina spongiae]|uniref:Methyltransferase domain-containing protein n=1 Tax=Aquimarina spongiae TaxID=570521 RepID=A0A1M6E4L1_9FLAO|nr:methyltransferase domain-containing protein [Aquimarina spongiae]SHI80345.1 Methyltransferase domain-containing protein [Aquimarina spongiae]
MNPKVRLNISEQLDDLSLSGKVLEDTLSSLGTINSIFGNHRQLTRSVLKYCSNKKYKENIHIVDLGCGGGDSLRYLSKQLLQKNINASYTGIDGNPKSIEFAKKNTPHQNSIQFLVADILSPTFEIPECDILISSHFIYHFDNQKLADFLKKIQPKNVKHIIFSELYRSPIAYFLFKIASRLLPISEMAKKDGLVAIQRAFTKKELEMIIRQGNVEDYIIRKKPFFRMIATLDLPS